MSQFAIFLPMFAMFVLTFVVWVYMYSKRIPFIQNADFDIGTISAEEFTRRSPADVVNPSDNLKNLFELPVLFYALCIYLFAVGSVDELFIILAWVFVAFRILHSAMHCTVNIVIVRFALYAVASLALWVMMFRALLDLIENI